VNEIIIYTSGAFVAGFAIAWIIRTINIVKIRKSENSANGSWERERLMKENAQKEVAHTHNAKEQAEREYEKKLLAAHNIMKQMDNDILLLQQSNEETEELLKSGKPELHNIKLQLIEANNTIARYKAQLGLK
jgi:translation initiation factor 2B subunit (eIF-2B alpha/beta/delta family)